VAGGSIKEEEGTFFKPKPIYFAKKTISLHYFFMLTQDTGSSEQGVKHY
jgi:hypothetical protein